MTENIVCLSVLAFSLHAAAVFGEQTTIAELAHCRGPASATLVATSQRGDIRYVEVRLPWLVWYETCEEQMMKGFCGAPYESLYLYRGLVDDQGTRIEQLKARGPTNRRPPWMVRGRQSVGSYFTFTVETNGTVVEVEYGTKVTNVFTVAGTNACEALHGVKVADRATLSNFVSRVTDDWHSPFIVVDRDSGAEFLVLIAQGQIWKLGRKEDFHPLGGESIAPVLMIDI